MSLRIAFTGPESSGKSTYSQWLANQHPHAVLVKEFARTFLESQKKVNATPEEFKHIVETSFLQFTKKYPDHLIVFDGDGFMLEVWNEWEFQIPMSFSHPPFQLEFLCYPDIAWEYDPLRTLPNFEDRVLVFNQLENKLRKSQANYVVLQGSREQKEAIMIASLNALLK